jgi:hypothetical protein
VPVRLSLRESGNREMSWQRAYDTFPSISNQLLVGTRAIISNSDSMNKRGRDETARGFCGRTKERAAWLLPLESSGSEARRRFGLRENPQRCRRCALRAHSKPRLRKSS